MDMRADDRTATPTNALTVWTRILNRLSERMARDYWAHAEVLGRYVDDIARARTFAAYDEAARTYRRRVLTLLEQAGAESASLWETELPRSVGLDVDRSNDTTTVSTDVVHDAPRPTVLEAASDKEVRAAAAVATGSKKPRARKAASKVDKDRLAASAPQKPRKRPRRPSKDAPPLG